MPGFSQKPGAIPGKDRVDAANVWRWCGCRCGGGRGCGCGCGCQCGGGSSLRAKGLIFSHLAIANDQFLNGGSLKTRLFPTRQPNIRGHALLHIHLMAYPGFTFHNPPTYSCLVLPLGLECLEIGPARSKSYTPSPEKRSNFRHILQAQADGYYPAAISNA